MAVPSSGILRLASIRNELENNVYEVTYTANATSLTSASTGTYGTINTANSSSDRPDGSTPHAMSEFYSYNHDEVTYVGLNTYSTSVPKPVFACGATTDTTWYFPDTTPAVNDQVYTNSGLSSTPSAGNYGYAAIGTTTGFRFTVDSSGVITIVASC